MANKGRTYAENLVGALDRSAYNQQRNVAQNTYNTNWQNVQNQYKNLQDKLKLQQERANRDFAEGLVNVAENSFNRQRLGSGNLSNRGLAASGLTNILNQADTAQKGEEIGKLLKNAGAISADTADRLSQATSKYAQEGTNLMGKLANTLGDIGDAETAAQNRYNSALASIAGSMDQREANNALQAAQRAASGSSRSTNQELADIQNQLEEFYKRASINELLSSSDMDDTQKANYLKLIFGMDNANKAVESYNKNINATETYNKQLEDLKKAVAKENRQRELNAIDNMTNGQILDTSKGQLPQLRTGSDIGYLDTYTPTTNKEPLQYSTNPNATPWSSMEAKNRIMLSNLLNKGITYDDLAALLYGNK